MLLSVSPDREYHFHFGDVRSNHREYSSKPTLEYLQSDLTYWHSLISIKLPMPKLAYIPSVNSKAARRMMRSLAASSFFFFEPAGCALADVLSRLRTVRRYNQKMISIFRFEMK